MVKEAGRVNSGNVASDTERLENVQMGDLRQKRMGNHIEQSTCSAMTFESNIGTNDEEFLNEAMDQVLRMPTDQTVGVSV